MGEGGEGRGGRERMNCKFETEGIDNAIICIYVYMLYSDESRVEHFQLKR